ncbi:hypothetical protein FE634_22025 [Nocardioides dongxiaopingii]|uniref:hypothetical protein n=1 Tax=Nocardioides TaxID=1839 RepID=UPI0010C76E58|nr:MULTISPECIES: hypothetical protein [Nocardioides]QDH11101.1 hypothetical protein FE634_22025 [Nocardioides sp. S-1144]
MDTERVQDLARQMAEVADRVRAIETRLSAQLAATEWVGSDRTRFEADWTAQHVVALRQAADVLDEAAHVAADNVREQEGASA